MTTTDAPIGGVSDTAYLIAHYRGVESARPDALFHDPFAAKLAGAKGNAIGAALNKPTTGWSIAMRTVIIDDLILQTIAEGADTILNLGSGFDARSYRLDLPKDLLWIEADYPEIISHKKSVLAAETPRCRLESVSIDLSNDVARREFLSSLRARSNNVLVLTEGVVPYLDNDQVGTLADDLYQLANSSRRSWIVEYFPKRAYIHGRQRQMKNAPYKFRPDDCSAFFASHGWQPRSIRYLGAEGIRLGRRAPLSLATRFAMAVARTLSPERGRLDRFLGYAVLEPKLPEALHRR